MRVVLACLAAASVLLTLPAPVAGAAETGDGHDAASLDFLVEPAPDAATSPRGGYFLLDLAPGAETRQSLALRNRGDAPIELALAAVDAGTGPTGGAVYRRPDAPVEAAGAWISLERDRVRLDAGERRTVGFDVTVPHAAESGDHLAGIAVWRHGDALDVEEAPGAVVAIEQRRVIAVHLTLPGPAEPVLRIDGVEPRPHAGGVRLLVHVANEGRGLTAGDGVLEVVEPAFEHTFEFGTFVPRTAVAYPVPWAEGQPPQGTYRARVRLEHGRWTETWEGTFVIGEDIARELERFPARGPRDAGGRSWWSWWVAAGAAGALTLVVAGQALRRLVRRGRRGRRGGRAPGVWSSAPATGPGRDAPHRSPFTTGRHQGMTQRRK